MVNLRAELAHKNDEIEELNKLISMLERGLGETSAFYEGPLLRFVEALRDASARGKS